MIKKFQKNFKKKILKNFKKKKISMTTFHNCQLAFGEIEKVETLRTQKGQSLGKFSTYQNISPKCKIFHRHDENFQKILSKYFAKVQIKIKNIS